MAAVVPAGAEVYELVELVPDRWRALVLLTAFASLRWGEVTALTREDLDLEKRTVRVCRQFITVPGGIQVGPPKSRAGLRIVSFPASIVPELQHHLDTFSGPGKYGLVFPNEHGRPFWRGNFNKAASWAAIREQLGLPTLHLHDLRHAGSRMGHDSTATRPGSRARYLSHGRLASPPCPRVDTCSQPLTGLGRAAAGGTNSAVINPPRPSR